MGSPDIFRPPGERIQNSTGSKEKKIVTPTIIPRSEHRISRANISENAVKVLYRLKNAGYQAHLVGGGV